MSKNTGLLIVTTLSKLSLAFGRARDSGLQSLYVHYHPKDLAIDLMEPVRFEKISKILQLIYSQSAESCKDVDVRILISTIKDRENKISKNKNIEFLLLDDAAVLAEKISEDVTAESLMQKFGESHPHLKVPSSNVTQFIDQEPYNDVVLGGTFDRIHVGHKILLSEAVLRAKKRVVVGVTDQDMISSKKLPELVLPLDQRISDVRKFLQDIDDTLNYEVVPIKDPYGPTATDPNMDLIVVSPETLRGAEKCNDVRKQNNLKPLDIYIIQLVEMQETCSEKEAKVSSSNQRMDLLGTKYKEAQPRPHLPCKPYIIGLIGGVASGKSKMAQRFEKFGAKVIDCDKLAHQVYEPDEDCFKQVVETFGADVVGGDGRIDRKALGSKVFGKPEELEKLNQIVWPKILEKVKEIIKNSQEEVVILEAALLIQAGWENECHEIWSCIIPPQEAIKRVMERNKLSEEEVKRRLASQPSNSTIVQHSNVVFSSLWSYEYSQQQAERAWRELKERLATLK